MAEKTGSDEHFADMFKQIVRVGSDAVIIVDESRHILYMNERAEALIGRKAETCWGEAIEQVVQFTHPDRKIIDITALLENSRVQDVVLPPNCRLRSINGSRNQIKGTILTRNCQGNNSALHSAVIFHIDDTFYRETFNGIPDILGIQDNNYGVIAYNKEGYNFLKSSPEDSDGKKCYELIGRSSPCIPCATTQCQQSRRVEHVEKYHNQSKVWLDCRSYPVLDEQGQLVHVIEHQRNITAQKLTENKLTLFKRALDHSLDAVNMTTFDGKAYYQNEAFSRLFGDLNDRSVIELFIDKTAGEQVLNGIQEGHDFSGELELVGQNHRALQVFYRAYPIRNHDSSVIGMVNLFTDITERKEWERRLIDSEQLHRDLYNTSLACLWRTDRSSGRFLKANLATARVFGFQSIDELLLTDGIASYYKHHEDRHHLLDHLVHHGEVNNLSIDFRLPDGSLKTLMISARLHHDRDWIEGFATDVTEQKRIENDLLLMKEDLRITLNSIGDAVIATDIAGTINRMNPAAEALTGWNRDEAIGNPLQLVLSLFDPLKQEGIEDPVTWILNNTHPKSRIDTLSLKSRDGHIREISYTANPIRDWTGKTTGIVVVFRDITEDYKIREQLRRSEERFRNLAELLPVGVFESDQELNLTFVNSEAMRMFQYTREDMDRGINAFDLLDSESRIRAKENTQRRFGGQIIPVVEYTCVKKDGTHFPVLLYINTISDDHCDYIGLRGVLIDITQRKQLEEKLKDLSLHDALTKLHNRAFFEEEMLRLSRKPVCPLSIVVCDIDGLKLINETMGHRKGDELLKVVADILKNSFGNKYMIARIGGDEFAILLPGTPEPETQKYCQEIQKQTDLHNSRLSEMFVSISVGYAVSGNETTDPSELFKIADHNMYRAKLHQSRSSRSDIIQALVKTLEARDYVADGHASRLQMHVSAMGHKLGLSDSRQRDLNLLCRFHDLGKVGIPDRILLKKGPLTPDEYREVKGHCEIGYRIALTVADLAPVADYILKHHECWDGSGYPLGLKGEQIPLESRIVAIVDAFDAMTHDRPYQAAMPKEAAVKILRQRAGKHFDPFLINVFLTIIDGE